MKKLLNYLAIRFFSIYAKLKGYSFALAASHQQVHEADKIFSSEGYKLPDRFEKQMELYKKNTLKFVAYYRGIPIGTVGLADPKIANRPFDLHGIDEKGDHFEIQSLIVSKTHRECSQLVLLGLFKEMYMYSVRNSINSWISFGLRQLYMTIRRYNKRICLININGSATGTPLANYLYENNIFDSCSIMRVEDFQPAEIFIRFLKKRVRKVENKIRFIFM